MLDLSTSNIRTIASLKEGKVVPIIPQGISMLPFIDGNKVYLLKKDQVRVGDIVLVWYGGNYILHRVYSITGEQVTLMGDGNLRGTEQVGADEILGTVIEIVTSKGRHRKPGRAWLWRHLLPVRKYLLKIHRKWQRLIGA